MQVAGIRRIGDRVEIIEVSELRPLAGDEVLLEVMAAGKAVSDWAPGDGVMTHPVPLRDQGTWAPRLIAPAGLLARKPDGASWETAAAFPVPALTAEQVLGDALGVHAGEQVLVNGASGVPGGAASAIEAVAGGGRLATITSDPPGEQRGITVSSIYVRPNGNQLRALATRFADGQLEIPVAASYRLADAAQALAQVAGGHAAGAVVLTP